MVDIYDYFGIVFVLFGIYCIIRPMNLAIVSGRKWKRDPELAKEEQHHKGMLWGMFFVLFGLGVIFLIPPR